MGREREFDLGMGMKMGIATWEWEGTGIKNQFPYTIAVLCSLSKSCFYHIRSLRHIRSSLDDAYGSLCRIGAIVSSRLYYVNSTLLGCLQKHMARLQRAQNALAIAQSRSPAAIPSFAIIFAIIFVLPPTQIASLVTY